MINNTRRLKRGATLVVCAAGVATLATGLLPVAAQVIGDPLGLISVGTSGESTNGSVAAASTSGTASGGLVGASGTGGANGGLVAASGTGCASNGSVFANVPVAVSGTGCASGFGTAVSGTGGASGGLVGVSGGNSSSGLVAISGDGPAGGTYGVDGWGDVHAEGSSLNGQTGNVSVNGASLMDEAGNAAHPVDDQLASVGWEPPASVVQAKQAERAAVVPVVAQMLAECAAGCIASSSPTANQPPRSMSIGVPQTFQNTNYTCGPSSTRIAVWAINGTDPGEGTPETYSNGAWRGGSGTAGAEKTHGGNGGGTGIEDVARVAYNLAPSSGYQYDRPGDQTHLMSTVVTDVYYGASVPNGAPNEPVIFDNAPNPGRRSDADSDMGYLKYWSGWASDGHYTVMHGYDTTHGGSLEIFDEFDPSYGGHTGPWGDHWAPLAEAWNVMINGVVW